MTIEIRTCLRCRRRGIILDAVVGRCTGSELEGHITVEIDQAVGTGTTTDFVRGGIHIVANTTDDGDIGITETVVVWIQGNPGQCRQVINMLVMGALTFHGLVAIAVGRIRRITMTGIT